VATARIDIYKSEGVESSYWLFNHIKLNDIVGFSPKDRIKRLFNPTIKGYIPIGLHEERGQMCHLP